MTYKMGYCWLMHLASVAELTYLGSSCVIEKEEQGHFALPSKVGGALPFNAGHGGLQCLPTVCNLPAFVAAGHCNRVCLRVRICPDPKLQGRR